MSKSRLSNMVVLSSSTKLRQCFKFAKDEDVVSKGDNADLLVTVGKSGEGWVLSTHKKATAAWISLLNPRHTLQVENIPVGGDEGQVCTVKVLSLQHGEVIWEQLG